ncbi:MAG: DUF885 domain-containing protein [Chitinophagales bacterium]
MKFQYSIVFAITLFLIAACNNSASDKKVEKTDPETYTKDFFEFLDEKWDEQVDRYPTWQSYLGIKKDYDKWSDRSDSMEIVEHKLDKALLDTLKMKFDPAKMTPQGELSYRMKIKSLEQGIERFKFRHYSYPVNQMHGTHSWIPSFFINIHRISTIKDAEDYLTRLSTVDYPIEQLIDNLELRAEKNIIAPKFVFPHVLDDCKNIISGYPLDNSADTNAVYADFKSKISALDSLSDADKKTMLNNAEKSLKTIMLPAYRELIAEIVRIERKATEEAGVWKFENGNEFYDSQLQKITTTELSADDIFNKGMEEVERIHNEMRNIKGQVDFEGDLQAFFKFMREDEQFYYSNDSSGKAKYLHESIALIDTMRTRLDELFITKPEAKLTVKRVEAFREKTAGKAFYQRPAPDGSRPGTYYVNLYDMSQMPVYQMEALAYHEGIPGHHMQLSIAQELEGLPKFRTLGGNYTAYIEGWGLYSEYIPREMGFYSDPYSDFGRLAMELWRACRMVVDAGIHSKKWTREEGIAFYSENTPNPYDDCVKMVERHIVLPGQATAYKVGQLKILELRKKAMREMGKLFDIREFHEVVIANGAVPLDILEENVEKYIASKIEGKDA